MKTDKILVLGVIILIVIVLHFIRSQTTKVVSKEYIPVVVQPRETVLIGSWGGWGGWLGGHHPPPPPPPPPGGGGAPPPPPPGPPPPPPPAAPPAAPPAPFADMKNEGFTCAPYPFA